MALSLSVPQENGVVVTYWCIQEINLHKDGSLSARVFGYVSADAAIAGDTEVTAQVYKVKGPGLPAFTGDVSTVPAQIYGMLKQLPDFNGATDV